MFFNHSKEIPYMRLVFFLLEPVLRRPGTHQLYGKDGRVFKLLCFRLDMKEILTQDGYCFISDGAFAVAVVIQTSPIFAMGLLCGSGHRYVNIFVPCLYRVLFFYCSAQKTTNYRAGTQSFSGRNSKKSTLYQSLLFLHKYFAHFHPRNKLCDK